MRFSNFIDLKVKAKVVINMSRNQTFNKDLVFEFDSFDCVYNEAHIPSFLLQQSQLQLLLNTPAEVTQREEVDGWTPSARTGPYPPCGWEKPSPVSGSAWSRYEVHSSLKMRKTRNIMERYSTSIKQLQEPQLRSNTRLLPDKPALPTFILPTWDTPLPQPHVLTHNPL